MLSIKVKKIAIEINGLGQVTFKNKKGKYCTINLNSTEATTLIKFIRDNCKGIVHK